MRSTQELGAGGRGSRLTGSSISGYMLGTQAFLKLFPDWEAAGGVGGTVLRREITQNIREQMVEEAWGLLKCGPCTKSSRELIKMQDFQKPGSWPQPAPICRVLAVQCSRTAPSASKAGLPVWAPSGAGDPRVVPVTCWLAMALSALGHPRPPSPQGPCHSRSPDAAWPWLH